MGVRYMDHVLRSLVKNALRSLKLRIRLSKQRRRLRAFLAQVRPISTEHRLIRVGGEGDGGYLVPDDLDGITACFSPGVAGVADFESDLARRGMRCFLADYSVDAPPVTNPLFDFEKKYLGPVTNDVYMTLASWLQRKAESDDLLLQMDIEGAEYDVILGTPIDLLARFRIVVVEFHNLHGLLDRMAFEPINLAFRKLLTVFEVIHIHPNNCCAPVAQGDIVIPPVMEFTFLRRDRILRKGRALTYPHDLDRANVGDRPDYPLPACWY
jgi:hypothetical protein